MAGDRPLEGIRVVEAGQLLAGPFCGQVLADFGADVIKLETPGVGDPMRQWGQTQAGGNSLWWPIVARGKRSVTLDLRTGEGQALARDLLNSADVFVENFRPGTCERWGLGWEELRTLNSRLIMTRVTGYGQTGPYASRAGYGAIGEAMGGLRYVTGDPTTAPSRVGISIGDTLAGLFAAIGTLVALESRHNTGRGQMVDAAIYESVLAVMESTLPEFELASHVRERSGAILPGVAPSNLYPTLDDSWVLIAANQDTVFRRLAQAMERQELADDSRFLGHNDRGQNQEELDKIIADWTRARNSGELLDALEAHSVPAGKIYRAPEMMSDPHFAARDAIVRFEHPNLGQFPVQNVVPKLSDTPGCIRWLGPELGQHTTEVLKSVLQLSSADIRGLSDRGVI